MPDRYLREALLRSDRWNALDVDARDLYIRLLMIVDDYGCFDGRENVIAQQAYYLGRDKPLPLGALHECGLIARYTNAGKPFITMLRWGETLRGRRRWPAPPINNDLPDIKYRGKYGTPLNFRNPTGTDPVSILLDVHGRPITPQPPEWRRVDSDWLPIATQQEPAQPRSIVSDNHSAQLLPAVTSVTESTPAITARSNSAQSVVSSQVSRVIEQQSKQQSAITSNSAQLPPTTPSTPTNGKVELTDKGEWLGVDTEQRVRWQGMFDALSIPDQLARAGAWLLVHPEERALYTARGELGAFLVRWLLNESKAFTVPKPRPADSKGKT